MPPPTVPGIPDKNSNLGKRDKSILEVFYSTGIRISEMTNLRIDNVDMKKKLIKVLGKGNKERYVIIGKQALDSLNEYIKIRF